MPGACLEFPDARGDACALRNHRDAHMYKKLFIAAACLAALVCEPAPGAQSKTSAAPAAKADATACYACHEPIKELHASGKHKAVACASCHEGVDKHLADASQRPKTKTDPA